MLFCAAQRHEKEGVSGLAFKDRASGREGGSTSVRFLLVLAESVFSTSMNAWGVTMAGLMNRSR